MDKKLKRMKKFYTLITAILFVGALFAQGSFPPAAGQTGSTAISKDSSIFVSWATQVTVTRGWMDIADPSLGVASFGTDADAIGPANPAVVSLGDSGQAILQFDGTIYDGPGPDFAVFENGFSDQFLELAFVEVSSDGIYYQRFPAVTEVSDSAQIGGFGSTDPTKIHNFAGKYRASFGTPFDLSDLPTHPNVDVTAISHIRLVDCVGNIQSPYATYDSQGNAVNDPYPTPFASSGFDLDAIGVMHLHPMVGLAEKASKISIYPNPVRDVLTLSGMTNLQWRIFTADGRFIATGNSHQIDTQLWKAGTYFISITCQEGSHQEMIFKQ